jgi:hypothetical protein
MTFAQGKMGKESPKNSDFQEGFIRLGDEHREIPFMEARNGVRRMVVVRLKIWWKYPMGSD